MKKFLTIAALLSVAALINAGTGMTTSSDNQNYPGTASAGTHLASSRSASRTNLGQRDLTMQAQSDMPSMTAGSGNQNYPGMASAGYDMSSTSTTSSAY